jgi:hypothetical protein
VALSRTTPLSGLKLPQRALWVVTQRTLVTFGGFANRAAILRAIASAPPSPLTASALARRTSRRASCSIVASNSAFETRRGALTNSVEPLRRALMFLTRLRTTFT